MEAPKKKETRTATQRIENLEAAVTGLYSTAQQMARDVMLLKDAVRLLGNKLDAVVKAVNSTNSSVEISEELISNYMIENNVEELRTKLEELVKQGVLVASSEAVTESSFVVGKEVDPDTSKVVNPRLQFPVTALQSEEARSKLIGAKAGELLTLGEGKLQFQLDEVYSVETPAPAAPEGEQAQQDSAEAAPSQDNA